MELRELVAKKVGLPRYLEHCLFVQEQAAVLMAMMAQKEMTVKKSVKTLNTKFEKAQKTEKQKSEEKLPEGK